MWCVALKSLKWAEGWPETKYRPGACRSVHSWAADSSIVFPLNILIRMNLSIKNDDNQFEKIEIDILK